MVGVGCWWRFSCVLSVGFCPSWNCLYEAAGAGGVLVVLVLVLVWVPLLMPLPPSLLLPARLGLGHCGLLISSRGRETLVRRAHRQQGLLTSMGRKYHRSTSTTSGTTTVDGQHRKLQQRSQAPFVG